ncbi:MAG: bifunctional adenosylcobinamide kinase/adenosylcobinamide-phosphate guanylyltransferase [Candidatus Hodgkinia cicadicola]
MLISGGVKSGKSALTKIMTNQISLMHLILSPTSEVPLALHHFRGRSFSCDIYQECASAARTLMKFGFNYSAVLVDGLHSWVASLLALKVNVANHIDELCEAICTLKGVVVVSTRYLGGCPPAHQRFMKYANRQLGRKCRRVYLSVHGTIIRLK